jgi:hypothetical protein
MQMDISDLVDYNAKFAKCFSPAAQTEILTVVGKRAGAAAVRYAAEYPEPSRKKLEKIYTRDTVAGKKVKPFLSKFKSDKQAYYVVFILGKSGKIPYTRGGKLGQSMTHAIAQVNETSVTTEVGSNLPYAKYVLGEDGEQSKYHKGTWLTLPERMNVNAAKLRTVTVTAYTTEIDKRLA